MNVFSMVASQKLMIFVGGILTGKIIQQFWSKWRSLFLTNGNDQIHDVIFFPDAKISCKDFFENVGGCTNQHCSFTHNITGLR